MSPSIRHRLAWLTLVALLVPVWTTWANAAKRDTDRELFESARSLARSNRTADAYKIAVRLADKRNAPDDYVYLAALLECKLGQRSQCIERCDTLLKRRGSRFSGQALKLKTLANQQNSRIRLEGRAALAMPSNIYATALENQRNFVDAGYNNVAGRVLDAQRRSLATPRPRPVTEQAARNALDIFTGQAAPPTGATQMARAYPSASTDGASAATADSTYQPTEAAPTPAAPAAETSFDGAFDFDAAFGEPTTQPPAPTPAAAAPVAPASPAPRPVLEQPDPFADVMTSPAPTKAAPPPAPTPSTADAAMAEHMRPIPEPPEAPAQPTPKPEPKKPQPAKAGGDDFGDIGPGIGFAPSPVWGEAWGAGCCVHCLPAQSRANCQATRPLRAPRPSDHCSAARSNASPPAGAPSRAAQWRAMAR